MSLRIGSLCTGYGGLDMAVREVFGGSVAWVADIDPGASAILAHHHPDVPNLGDIAAVRWAEQEPVDVLTAGFPCQDVSSAGKRAGLKAGTRSGLWSQVAHAIHELKPRTVVIENVKGLLSANADRAVEPGTAGVDPATGRPLTLRALGAVLGDLAGLGFDAEWLSLRASDVGAPHQRTRVFLLAWPAHPQGPRPPRPGLPGRPAERGAAAAHPDGLRGHLHRTRRPRRDEPATHRLPAAHPGDSGRRAAERDVRPGQPDPDRRPAAHTDCGGLPGDGELPVGRDALRLGPRADTDRRGQAPAAHAEGDGRHQGRPEPARLQGGSDTSLGGGTDWGPYTEAITRWAQVCGRPAPGQLTIEDA